MGSHRGLLVNRVSHFWINPLTRLMASFHSSFRHATTKSSPCFHRSETRTTHNVLDWIYASGTTQSDSIVILWQTDPPCASVAASAIGVCGQHDLEYDIRWWKMAASLGMCMYTRLAVWHSIMVDIAALSSHDVFPSHTVRFLLYCHQPFIPPRISLAHNVAG